MKNRKTYYYKLEDIDLNGTFNNSRASKCNPKVVFGDSRDIQKITELFSNNKSGVSNSLTSLFAMLHSCLLYNYYTVENKKALSKTLSA